MTIQAAPTDGPDGADVIIVGARCAGAATAILLAGQGHDVLVVDRAAFPSDTLSTHAIARTGVVQLDKWGLLDDVLATGAPPIREAVFHTGPDIVRRPVKDRHGVDLMVAPRRHRLDPLLQDAAQRAGARLRTGVTITGVRRDATGRVTGVTGRDETSNPVELGARLVVGADGLRSRIARSVDAPMVEYRGADGAAHYSYFAGDWSAMEYYVAPGAFAGIFPTNDGEACVWVCTPSDDAIAARQRHRSPEAAFRSLLASASPALVERLDREATPASGVRGMTRMPNQLRTAHGAGWALVGDAGYHRDAITGHGISDALRDAELLAHAVDAVMGGAPETEALSRYQAARDRLLRPIFTLTCELATFPPPMRFVQAQRELSIAIDQQAGLLAASPGHPWSAAA